jgi:hypothetical protein
MPHAQAPRRLLAPPLPSWRALCPSLLPFCALFFPLPYSLCSAWLLLLRTLAPPTELSGRHLAAASQNSRIPRLGSSSASSAAGGVRGVVHGPRGICSPAPVGRRRCLPAVGPLCSSFTARSLEACSGMGQQASKHLKRLQELEGLIDQQTSC